MANEQKQKTAKIETKPLVSVEAENRELLIEIRKILKQMRWVQTIRLLLVLIFLVAPIIAAAIYLPRAMTNLMQEVRTKTNDFNLESVVQQMLPFPTGLMGENQGSGEMDGFGGSSSSSQSPDMDQIQRLMDLEGIDLNDMSGEDWEKIKEIYSKSR